MNKKKSTIIAISIVVVCIIIGIGSFLIYKNHNINVMIDKGIKYIDNKDYEKAIATFDLVLNEKSNNEKAIDLKHMVNQYLDAQKLYKDNKFKECFELLNSIKNYNDLGKFTIDVNTLKKEAKSKLDDTNSVSKDLVKIKDLVKNGKLDEADKQLDALKDKYKTDEQKSEIKDLQSRISDKKEIAKKEKELTDNKKEMSKQKAKTRNGWSFPLSVSDGEKYLQDKLSKLRDSSTYHFMSYQQGGQVYMYKENQNVGVNGPNFDLDPVTGDIWEDGSFGDLTVVGPHH